MLAVSFIVFVLAAGSAGTGLWVAGKLTEGLQNTDRSAAILRNHMEADMMHDALRADVLSALLASLGTAGMNSADVKADTAEHVASFRKVIAENTQLATDPRIRDALGKLADPLETYIAAADEIVGAATQNPAAATSRLPDFLKQFSILESAMAEASATIENAADATARKAQETALVGHRILFATIAFGTVFAVALSLFVNRAVVRPIRTLAADMRRLAGGDLDIALTGARRRDEVGEIGRAVRDFQDFLAERSRKEAEEADRRRRVEKEQSDHQSATDTAKAEDLRVLVHAVEAGFDGLAAGDLTVRMDGVLAPEFEPIRRKFNTSVASLEETIGSVVNAVGTMRMGLNEITVAAGDLSHRTESQAASLEETVAALAEVMRGINGTAQGADDARAAAVLAQGEADKGGRIVADAVDAMAAIEQSSDKIGNIISVIDEIAFQTNLLALNAGVEAARAGEAGRGFAVVAQEVRGLAQRSAEAAKEIKDLIQASSAQVGRGVDLVSATGRSLDQIVGQVSGVAQAITEMAKSTREQSASLKEVSVAADQMDKVTQQNAAMVEETTAATQSLARETEALAGLTGGFRTKEAMPAARLAPSAPPMEEVGWENAATVLKSAARLTGGLRRA
jgi:methyl-accepting chemotaxis protein